MTLLSSSDENPTEQSKTDSSSSSELDHIYSIVQDELIEMNQFIPRQLSSDVELVEEIGRYIITAGGKRFRPLLVLLTTGMLTNRSAGSIKLATVIEFLHTATLLHDDVVDHSALRRGRMTVNEKWGNPPSVLVGDFLYSRAFQLMVDIGSIEVMRILSNATNLIAEGEVMQLANLGNLSLSVESYRQIINCKTALLFEAAAHSAAALAKTKNHSITDQTIKSIKSYGHHFGMAYQLIDDLLDYTGDQRVMGKNAGDDLSEGKLTLPIILALATTKKQEKHTLLAALEEKSKNNFESVSIIIASCGALEKTKEAALREINLASEALAGLPENEYRTALETLTSYSAERIY